MHQAQRPVLDLIKHAAQVLADLTFVLPSITLRATEKVCRRSRLMKRVAKARATVPMCWRRVELALWLSSIG